MNQLLDRVFTIKEIQESLALVFDKHDFIDKVYLFGSYARGEATGKSDIDLFVIRNRETYLDFYSLYDEVQDALGKNTDIIHDGEILVNSLKEHIERERVLIYER